MRLYPPASRARLDVSRDAAARNTRREDGRFVGFGRRRASGHAVTRRRFVDAFAARDRRAPRGSLDLTRVARPFCAWLCDKATTSSEAAKAAAGFGSAVLARCATAQALLGKATAQPLLAEAVLDAAAFSRERGAVVRALFAEVDHNEDALLLFSSSFALLLRALDDAALAAGWSGDDLRGIVSLLSKFLRRELWDEPILQKEPDAKRLATVAVCARLFSQLRDRVARQLDDDQLWLWDGVRAASVGRRRRTVTDGEDDDEDAMDVDGDLPWARRSPNQPMPSERPPLHASLEPRVAQTLAACPFVVGFQQRVALFQGRVEKDRQQRQSDAGFDMSMRPLGFRVKVRRDQIFEDAFRQLHKLSSDQLKGRVQVTFISETGQEEAGIGGGGVFKKF